jgi:hypothetical protein
MKNIIAVTGPLRSGTSCLTGLLEQCGFDLGRNIRVLRRSSEDNPRGHFEPDLLFAINARLVSEVEWEDGIFHVPDAHALTELAAKRQRYFQLFLRKFDGQLCKDPLFCLTLSLWEKHWPALRQAIYCLRHPLAVARSMEKRYGISLEHGLQLWHTYTTRFFQGTSRCELFVFDFDAFQQQPQVVLAELLTWLGRPQPGPELQQVLAGFWERAFVHWTFGEATLHSLPVPVRELYLEIRAHAGPWSYALPAPM